MLKNIILKATAFNAHFEKLVFADGFVADMSILIGDC